MYRQVSSARDYPNSEKEIIKLWQDNKIFEKTNTDDSAKPVFAFYDGPPTANGKPHIGHMLTRAIKDMIPRYRTMKGYYVPRKAGWDTHGLPVELEVEGKLGIDGKEQIEDYGIAPFIDECKKSVWKYKGMWEEFSKMVGYWADMEKPYVTYENEYIESVWWALSEIWRKELLYKGFKIVPYCPRCGTPLSSHEVAQGYKDVKERSAIVKFKLLSEDCYILAWTTTPWTLPSNVALCVNPDEEYVKVEKDGEKYILAKALCESVLGEFTVLQTYRGKELEYLEYAPLWKFVNPSEKAWYITCGEFVTLTDGTGVVHMAPAFGEDDSQIGKKYGLPFIQLVDSKGELTEETLWAGTFCKDADKSILENLSSSGNLFSAPVMEHSYPHCWRCNTPLIYYARESWFIKMTDVKEKLLKNNDTITWMPESLGKGRFGDWLENVQDWGISRNRYWGTPLNIWQCDCGNTHCVGSIQELKSMSKNCPDDIELHRPFIDDVTIQCESCSGEMHRVPEVIDCWFDSGAMPFAQHHYPFENKKSFEEQFPAAFISEAVDQTRGWFYSLLAISTLIFDKAPYKNVIVLGHVLDENGHKMSKSKGNAIDPMEALSKYGADAIRWYFYSNSAPWLPNRFYDKAVIEGQRKVLATLWNTYSFYVLYASIDNFDPTKYELENCALTIMDRWLLSRLYSTVQSIDKNLDEYKIPEAAKDIHVFLDDMSNWYVRRCRERFWSKNLTEDKIAAYKSLHTAIVTICMAAAPMVPFITEDIYQNLVVGLDSSAPESIHLCSYPEVLTSYIDKKLEGDMAMVLNAISLGRAARNDANIKNRQPLQKLYITGDRLLDNIYIDIISGELNVREIELVKNAERFVNYQFKPQLKLLGARFGKQINEVKQVLSEIDGTAKKNELDTDGAITIELSTGTVSLTADELLISTTKAEGYTSASDGAFTVILDTTLTDELIEEGFVREIVSKIQAMRKDAGFSVTDIIVIGVSDNAKILEIARKNSDIICGDTLAAGIEEGTFGATAEWNLNGEATVLSVKLKG